MGMNVNRIALSRPRWNYTPAMQLPWRMIVTAMIDALKPGTDGLPTDEGLLARDWIATSEMPADPHSDFVSFPRCCEDLGIPSDAWRVFLIGQIDDALDYDTDECWARLEYLRAQMPDDDEDPVFATPEWARVVPVLDQCRLWASAESETHARQRKQRLARPGGHVHTSAAAGVQQLALVM